jgi:hypothetical protein
MKEVGEIRLQVTHQLLTAFELSVAIKARMLFLIGGRFGLDGRDNIRGSIEVAGASLQRASLCWS